MIRHAALGVCLALLPLLVWAQTVGLGSNMSFGSIEMASVPLSGDITMGTNGIISYPANASGSGTGVVGRVTMAGTTAGRTINIRCSSSGVIKITSGNDKFNINPVKVSFSTAQTYAAATTCTGTNKTVLSPTLSANTALNVVLVGGLLQLSGKSPTSGSYTTTVSGATAITIRVIFL